MSDRRKSLLPLFLIIFIPVVILALAGLFLIGRNSSPKNSTETSESTVSKTSTLTIAAAGDAMFHIPQLTAAEPFDYDFNDTFEEVKPLVSAADVAVCNLEAPLGGKPYDGYPLFSAPDTVPAALRRAGFDAVTVANNHILDRGIHGVSRTARQLSKDGLPFSGIENNDGKTYAVIHAKTADAMPIRVALLSWTYNNIWTQGGDSASMVNCFRTKSESAALSDLAPLKKQIADARADGAAIVVVYFHWGDEYNTAPNDLQKAIAQFAADSGVDIILGSHPHVCQTYETITAEDGRGIPCYYSLGNFCSNQRRETLGDIMNSEKTEYELLAQLTLTLEKSGKDFHIKSIDPSYTPMWMEKYYSPTRQRERFVPLPLTAGWKNGEIIQATGDAGKAAACRRYLKKLLGNPQPITLGE